AAVLLGAVLVAAASPMWFAGSFNDSSRLATVECLVDHGTLAIDESVYVRPPPRGPGEHPIFTPVYPRMARKGTGDKIFVKGHFYSDKPPVPAFFLAAVYKVVQLVFGLHVRERPDVFYCLMALVSCGLPYVVGVWCVYRLAGALGLGPLWQVLLTASFGLATMAPAYARSV